MAANQVDFKILPSDQFSVYSPQTRSDKVITYFTLLSKLRGDILSVGQDDDPNDIVSAFYSSVGGTQTLHLVKADGSEITASTPEQIISGTVNFVSKFTTANDIGDSQIFDNGTNVGIGTTSMTHKLQLGTGGVFADYYQLDTTYSNGFVIGAISWDIDNGTADIGLSSTLKLKIGQDDTWYVKNQSGSTITKGTVVYASGTLGASGRITIAPMIANGTIPSRFLLGIVAESILDGEDGYVIAKGKIRQINTNAFNDGDVLWLSPTVAGTLTATEPTAPNLKLAIAFVVHKATNGILAVRATEGVRIADASDVEYAGAADNSFLVYNSATGVWEDEAVSIFKTIAVAGQSSVVADTYDDTLTLAAGTNVSITTDATTDTITINSTDQFVGTVTSVATTAPITGGTITATGTIGITQSGAAADGYLSSTDWNTFNSKEPALTKGNLTEATSSVLTITGGTGAVIGSGTTIQVSQATTTTSGFLSSTDWNTFNNKQGTITLTTTGTTGAATFISNTLNIPNYADQFVGTVTSVAALTIGTTGTDLSSTVVDSTTTPVITLNVPTASAANRGALSSADWTTFNSKEPALTKGNLTEATSAVLTITGGTGAVIGTGTSIQVAQSGVSTSGFLSSTDWNTFNGKQNALTFSVPLVNTSGTVSIPAATSLVDGYLSATDFATFNGKQDALTLTTTGTTGAATLIGATLNIPNYADQFVGTVTSVDMSVPTGFAISGNPIITSGTLAVAFAAGYSLPTDASQTTWNTAYNDSITAFAYNTSTGALTLTQQDAGTLTATVTLQPFTTSNLTEGTNLYYTDTRARLALSAGTGISYDSATGVITNSSLSSGGTVTSVAALTLGTTGTDLSSTVVNGTTTPVITLQVPTASATNRGALSSTDWTTFNNKQGTITLTTTGSTGAATFVSNTLNIPSYTDQFVGTVTSVDLTAGTGITVSGGPIITSGSITVNNSDRGSSQNIFKNINVITSQDWDDSDFVWNVDDGSWSGGIDQEAIVADNNNDTLFIESVGGISITTDSTTDTIYFDNIDKGSEQNIFKNFAVSGQSTIVADLNDDTLTVASGTGISLTTNDSTDTLTITNSAPDQVVVLTAGTGITTSGTYPNFTVTNSDPDQTVVLTAGTGITTSGTYPSFTVTNDDRGSSQNIFKNIAVAGQTTIVADTNDDTLTVVGGTGISVTTDHTTDTLTITNTSIYSIPIFAAYSNVSLSLTPANTELACEFTVQSALSASFFSHSTTVDPNIITVLSSGIYEISFGYGASNGNNQIASLSATVAVNGVGLYEPFSFTQLDKSTFGMSASSFVNTYIYGLAANDEIEIYFTADYVGGSTGTITITPSGFDGSTYITIKKIG